MANKSPWRSTQTLRWSLLVMGVAMVGAGLVLLFMLTLATGNRGVYDANYAALFRVNLAVAAMLLLVIAWFGVRLGVRLYQGKFGSRLLLKLAAVFAVVGLLPGLLIYTVSYQFVSRSIESWFDVRVESALAAGLNLGRTTLNVLSRDLSHQARVAANEMASVPERSIGLTLENWRERLGATDVVLWDNNGTLIGSAGDSRYALNPERPSAASLRMVREQGVLINVEGLDDAEALVGDGGAPVGRMQVLTVVEPVRISMGLAPRFLQIVSPLPDVLVADAVAVQAANREYQERALGREGLRRMYIGTLTLALFLAVFGAVVLAVVLGNQLLRPLLVLAEGMREVAAGNLSPKQALAHRDELGGLTRTFARMTDDLAQARADANHSMSQLDAARAHVQTILDNLTSGVVVLRSDGTVQSANPGADTLLHTTLKTYQGTDLREVPGLARFGDEVLALFQAQEANTDVSEGQHWQHTFELGDANEHNSAGLGNRTLVARGAGLPHGGWLLVIDDVTDMVSAQRSKAWGEVARRLAHEIKNPLTPIQLAAERMAMKLAPQLPESGQSLLSKSVRTIVEQVDAMKHMVNEFRDYGRLPSAELSPLALNPWLRDMASLYENSDVPVLFDLSAEIPLVLADAQQLRQVLHNVIQNAQDACSQVSIPLVKVSTRWSQAGDWVCLDINDNGGGFDASILKRVFEPYVTTKPKGTGLGLAVVQKIMEEHGGKIQVSNTEKDGKVLGAKVSLSFVVAK
ncbi:MAG: ATP-binding protein [Hydrogenophaga sp.]|jgi:nitrogen fixation/metabolism regulation signal transduction histidine kinase|nr:ATP-binding protein [Hydrogenophaga sp.]